jgi:alcohol/geraniol dehydrogenase (NADP+)
MGKSLRPLHKAEPMRLFRGELPRRSPCGLAFTEINSANEIHMPTFHAYAANTARGPLQPFEFDPGELGHEEVEIKVSHCGICHSDLSMLDNDWSVTTYPFVPGHEAVGAVVALGEVAKGLKIGQRVGIGWSAYSCLSCDACLAGDHNLCAHVQGTIVGRHGAFADHLCVQWAWARPLPESLALEKAGDNRPRG